MSASCGVKDALKILKKLKNCDTLSEADLLEALSHLPCPKKWNVGDLHAALLAGWGEVVREMVEVLCGYDKVLCGRRLDSLLLGACYSGDLSVVRFLVSDVKCWSVHESSTEGKDLCRSYLAATCQEGQVLEYLVKRRKATLPENLRAQACYYGHLYVVKYLVTQSYVRDCLSLLLACTRGHIDVVKYLVTEAYADPKVTDENGLTPLHMACMNGHLNVVKYLVTKAHVDPIISSFGHGLIPLHLACENGHLEIIKCLLSDGHVSPNFADEDGRTPLHFACQNGDLDVIRYLVTETHAQKVFERNFVAVKYVETNTHDQNTKALVTEVYGNPNTTDKYGLTPLYTACENGHLDVVKYLIIEAHYDPFFINKYGSTPLHSACKEGQLDVVKYLVTEIHVDPNVTSINGSTPLHFACRNGHLNVVEYLATEVRDVNPNVTDDHGSTPLHYAVYRHAIFTTLLKTCTTDGGLKDSDLKHFAYANYRSDLAYTNYRRSFLLESLYNQNINDEIPLYLARKIGHLLDVIKYLLKGLADQNTANRYDLPLHIACRKGNLDIVKCLVEAHADPNHIFGSTPLYFACEEGHLDIVQYLIAKALADPNLSDKSGLTPLYPACKEGHLDVVKYLITEGHADPNHVSEKLGTTPLCSACKKGHLDVVKYLITEGHADPNFVSEKSGLTPLYLACEEGHLDVVKYLITESHADPNLVGDKAGSTPLSCEEATKYLVAKGYADPNLVNEKSGFTPLYSACKGGHLDVVKFLITKGHVDTNMTYQRTGITLLHLVCNYWQAPERWWDHFHESFFELAPEQHQHQLDVIKHLISKAHLDPNTASSHGLTPLHLALMNGCPDVAEYLLTEANVYPNVADASDITPLHLACYFGYLDIVKILVTEAQVNPNVFDKYGLTPLHLASAKGHTNVVQHLVTNSVCVQPNIVANKRCGSCGYGSLVPCINHMVPDCGYSAPLHLASINGHVTVVKCLVTQARADPNVKDKQGSTPLQLACQYGHLDVAKCLITEGHVDPNCKDEFGLTPLHYACKTDHTELIEWLFKTVNGPEESSISPNTSMSASLSDDWHVIGDVPAASERAPLSDQWYLIRLFLENGTAEYQFLPNLKILVVGNASAGKSTLVKALQDKLGRKGLLDKFTSNFRTVSGVELKTAGIVPTTIQTESLGYMTFYDFAGQCEYYSSHAAMLKNLTSSLDSLVLIVIDISQDIDKVNSTLNYWNKFVSSLTADKESKPCQQIVFTHSDLLSDSPMFRVNQLKKLVPSNSEMLDSSICINCTKASSNGLTFVYDLVRNNSSKLQSELKQHKMRPFFAASNYFMSGFCADKVSFPLKVLLDKFNNVPLPLVKHLLHTLSKQGKILFFENDENVESSWIILDVQTLMAEVNGTIFSPESFKQHHDMSSSTGVVPLSAISTVFSDHNKKMIVDFLCHFEFCHKIASTEADLIGRSQEDAVRYDVSEESYYFFPALVRTDRPVEVFSTPGLSYKFGWFLKCIDGDFLFPRFPHVLVLRLAFSFALAPDPEDVDTSCPVLQRKCDVWKCGISWQNRDGVEVVVEMVEESTAVVVVVGCLEGREWAGMRLRSKVIRTVLEVKEEHAKETEMSERFVHPKELGSYPLLEVDKLSSFTMHEISCVIANGQHVVTSKRSRHMISLKELLFFEPYSYFGHEITSELFNEANSDVEVPETFLYDAGKSVQVEDHVMVQESLKMILPLKHSDLVGLIAVCDEQYKNDPAHQCYLILRVWKKGHCNPTYFALKEALNGYSVFACRNPLRPS